MNNKAIIEFGFRRIWRILQILEGVIHLGLWPLYVDNTLLNLQNSSYPTQPHSIIAKDGDGALSLPLIFLASFFRTASQPQLTELLEQDFTLDIL